MEQDMHLIFANFSKLEVLTLTIKKDTDEAYFYDVYTSTFQGYSCTGHNHFECKICAFIYYAMNAFTNKVRKSAFEVNHMLWYI